MNYERFLKDKLIKKQKPGFKQISHQLQRSLKDLNTAEANLDVIVQTRNTTAKKKDPDARRANPEE
jgi:hypothetical protein